MGLVEETQTYLLTLQRNFLQMEPYQSKSPVVLESVQWSSLPEKAFCLAHPHPSVVLFFFYLFIYLIYTAQWPAKGYYKGWEKGTDGKESRNWRKQFLSNTFMFGYEKRKEKACAHCYSLEPGPTWLLIVLGRKERA